MGIQPGAGLDAWLRAGGVVVASSDRAARAIQSEFHRRRRSEGLAAWAAPGIFAFETFVRNAWEARNTEGLLLLNPAQEQAVWASIIHSEQHLPTALPASVRRLAAMAMDAHELLCSFAPELLRNSERAGWDEDAGAFSEWLREFNEYCLKNRLISAARVPVELISSLKAESSPRLALRVVGFDRVLPTQRAVFDAWGQWDCPELEQVAEQVHFYAAGTFEQEFEACAFWCHKQLIQNSRTRLLVITQELTNRRGEIERAFLNSHPPGARPKFEFSLGVPLAQITLARSALLLLRWLNAPLSEIEVDWLFSSGFAANPDESASLQACMRTLRRLDLQRTDWKLDTFLSQKPIVAQLPSTWKQRMLEAQRTLKRLAKLQQPGEWSDRIPHLLDAMGWCAYRPESNADFQAHRRWQQALDTTASLGFDGRKLSYSDFLASLSTATDEVLFAPESTDAPIQIAGPAEAAGLTADAIWFLGADEDSWPAVGSMHPFLPVHVQRRSAMPHATALQDWEFSSAVSHRLLASAPEVIFSYARQKEDVETRPSRLIAQLAGFAPQAIPSDFLPTHPESPLAAPTPDPSTAPFAGDHLRGGASSLSSQSQCPFKAFATVRLTAQGWDAAEAGLSAKQRGQILHKVLHSVWSGKAPGIKSHHDLIEIEDLPEFVRLHVRAVLATELPAAVRDQMPAMYRQLEEVRLIRVVAEWLEFERTRIPFTVEQTEAQQTVTIAGINMNLRLDRVDRLHDDSHLVIDYKTGNVDPKSWDLPRPDDVQLPLYKLFGLEPLQPSLFDSFGGPASGGMVFAKVRSGETCFAGRVADAKSSIDPTLSGNSALVRRKLTAADEAAWKNYIERITQDFLHGRAAVDPRDYPDTCDRCGLYSICRIQEDENRARSEKGIGAANANEE